jgi:hypothetical protein
MYTKLDEVKGMDKDFDLLCKVIKIYEKDEYTYDIRIRDLSQQIWYLSIEKSRFHHLTQSSIVRIRGTKVDKASVKGKQLVLTPCSNILKLLQCSKLGKELI